MQKNSILLILSIIFAIVSVFYWQTIFISITYLLSSLYTDHKQSQTIEHNKELFEQIGNLSQRLEMIENKQAIYPK